MDQSEIGVVNLDVLTEISASIIKDKGMMAAWQEEVTVFNWLMQL